MNDVTQILVADRSLATPLPPSSSCRWSTTSCANWLHAKLVQEKPGQTLQATALVHEAYVRLVGGQSNQHWNSRGHFFAAAAEAMRRILVEQARRKNRVRHGGELRRIDFDSELQISDEADENLLALDEALERLAIEDLEAAEVVKLRYFAGLTIEETASALGISVRTVNRHWAYARAWLFRQLR